MKGQAQKNYMQTKTTKSKICSAVWYQQILDLICKSQTEKRESLILALLL